MGHPAHGGQTSSLRGRNTGFTRQRENEEYEPRQWDYDTGLPMKEAVRNKMLYDVKK